MPFHGPRLVKTTCSACHYSRTTCMDGDVWLIQNCPRCKKEMEIKPLDNPLLTALINQVPPALRRKLFNKI